MSLVNLNEARKAKSRQTAKREADENAARFGRTKAQRLFEAAEVDKAAHHLDQQKFEDE